MRELIFEDVRRELFPELPSRRTCLWVIDDNKDDITYWINGLEHDQQEGLNDSVMVKLLLSGKVFKGEGEYLKPRSYGLAEWRQQAINFWTQTRPVQSAGGSRPEIMFEGTARVLDLVPLVEYVQANGIKTRPHLAAAPKIV